MARSGEGELLRADDPFSSAQFPTGVTVQQLPMSDFAMQQGPSAEGGSTTPLSDVALAWTTRQARDLSNYRSLRVEPTTVAGQPAILTEYAYVAPPAMGGAAVPPTVARAQELLVQQGEMLNVITFAADSTLFEAALPTWRDILASITLQ